MSIDKKRLFDLTLTVPSMMVVVPVVAGCAILVRMTSEGPAFFRHTRVGRGRKPFDVIKIRTMTQSNAGPELTSSGDTRVTEVGRLLRRLKLDELPQLFNVLKGEMSLVGPRPEVQRYVDAYPPEGDALFEVRPGLTDPASLAFSHEEALLALADDAELAYLEVLLPMKLELALEGVDASSVTADARIILRTLTQLLRRHEEEHPKVQEAMRRIEALNVRLASEHREAS